MSKLTTRPMRRTYTELLEQAESWQEVLALKPTCFVPLQFEPFDSWLLDSAPEHGFGVFDPYADETTDEGYETLLEIMEQVLTPTEYTVFCMRAEQDLSYALIGRELQTSKQSAHATFKRAQKKLLKVLSNE